MTWPLASLQNSENQVVHLYVGTIGAINFQMRFLKWEEM